MYVCVCFGGGFGGGGDSVELGARRMGVNFFFLFQKNFFLITDYLYIFVQ